MSHGFCTRTGPRTRAYNASETKQANNSCVGATGTTPIFPLTAPNLRIIETAYRARIQALRVVASGRRLEALSVESSAGRPASAAKGTT